MTWTYVVVLLLTLGYVSTHNYVTEEWPHREHRGAWIATVTNIDWPLAPTYTPAEQQSQLKHLIYQIKRAGLNAVYFQVRNYANCKSTQSKER